MPFTISLNSFKAFSVSKSISPIITFLELDSSSVIFLVVVSTEFDLMKSFISLVNCSDENDPVADASA